MNDQSREETFLIVKPDTKSMFWNSHTDLLNMDINASINSTKDEIAAINTNLER